MSILDSFSNIFNIGENLANLSYSFSNISLSLLLTQLAIFAVLMGSVIILKKYFFSDWTPLIKFWGWMLLGLASVMLLLVAILIIFTAEIKPVLLPMVVGSLAGIIFTLRKISPTLFRRVQSIAIVIYIVAALGVIALLYNSNAF